MMKKNTRSDVETSTDSKSTVGASAPTAILNTGRVDILGIGQDEKGAPWSELQVRGSGDTLSRVLINLDEPALAQCRRLNQAGAHIVSDRARAEMTTRLQEFVATGKPFRVATRVGVYGGAFVLPDRIYSPGVGDQPTLRNALMANDSLGQRYKTAGSAKSWLAIAPVIACNTRMMFALGLMLIGPLALFGEFEQVAGQLVGEPGDGKTAIGAVTSTIWGLAGDHGHGREYGFGETWNQTPNYLERLLSSVSHTGLFLDETGLSNHGAAWLDVIMRIASGKTKGRLTEAEGPSWYVGILSTSNASVAELARRSNRKADRAHFDRLIDIPKPKKGFGMFEDLCGYDEIGLLVEFLKDYAMPNCGMIGRAYVRALVAERACNHEMRARWIHARVNGYCRQARKFAPDTERLNRKFGTVYAAIALACDLNVLPFDRKLVRHAIAKCHRDHLRFIAQEQKLAGSRPFDTIRTHVARRRADMVSLAKATGPIAALAGVVVRQGGEERILFASTVFDRACGGHHAGLEVKAHLDKVGAIKTIGKGKTKRFAVKETIGGKRVPVINVRASAFV